MPELPKQKHEQFVKGVAEGLSATKAYTNVYGEGPGNAQSANRLLRNAQIAHRLEELTNHVNAVAEERLVERAVTSLRDRETRIAWLDDLAQRYRRTIEARSKAYAQRQAKNGKWVEVPGGDQGMVVPVEGRKGDEVWKFDGEPARELKGALQQIAQELGQWSEKRDSRFVDENGKDRGVFTLDTLREAIDQHLTGEA